MSTNRQAALRRTRHRRVRKKLAGTAERPRLAVFRSSRHMVAQVIDDLSGTTVAAAASTEPGLKSTFAGATRGGYVEGAKALGRTIAERLIAKGITRVVFDRGGFLYHGRVKAAAEAAREAGLEF